MVANTEKMDTYQAWDILLHSQGELSTLAGLDLTFWNFLMNKRLSLDNYFHAVVNVGRFQTLTCHLRINFNPKNKNRK